MSTETSREEQGAVPGRRGGQFAASLAISRATITSRTTVAPTASIHGARTVNVRALGTVESEAEAESSLLADGTASIAIALEFSDADVLARIDGKVQADMATPGGEVVKFEFDPTVPAAALDQRPGPRPARTAARPSSGSARGLRHRTAVSWLARAPIFQYIGADISTARDARRPRTTSTTRCGRSTSEPWGYIDYANDRIVVYNLDNGAGNWVVVNEDTADYSPRRGTSIGGLSPGTYVIVTPEDNPDTAVDESRYIKLARTEQQAIDAYAWEAAFNTGVNPYVINLTPGATTNTRSFDADDIDDDTITFDGVGNTFELGQAVDLPRARPHRPRPRRTTATVWQSPNAAIDGDPYVPLIEGLEHGDLVLHDGRPSTSST